LGCGGKHGLLTSARLQGEEILRLQGTAQQLSKKQFIVDYQNRFQGNLVSAEGGRWISAFWLILTMQGRPDLNTANTGPL
jgi:hypothetical protein